MLDVITFITFIIFVAFLVYLDRRNVKLEGIIFIRRTKRGKNFLDSTAKKHPRFWKIISYIGIFVSVLALAAGTYLLVSNAFSIFHGISGEGVRLVLPGPQAATDIPALLIVPWWMWVCGVAIVMVPHETMHGIMCRIERIRIKSIGWILLLFIPGAFVEPDENQLKKAKRSTRLKVYAAGSFANIIVAFLIFLLFFFSFSMLNHPAGAAFISGNDTPTYYANLSTGTITAINGIAVHNQSEFAGELQKYSPGDIVEVNITQRYYGNYILTGNIVADISNTSTYTMILYEDQNNSTKPYLVKDSITAYAPNSELDYNIANLLFWMFLFSAGIGIVNLLPIKPLDGGFIFEDLIGYISKNTIFITKIVSIIVFGFLLFNLFGPIFF
jgi:membrane-associated protease RseP (regulator of RpoE activity)